jgi:hypothetical protein
MLRSSKTELICAGVVFVVALLLYSWTLAPTVTLVDSGELIVAAHSLGIAHPPGFPLYLMLAHLASLVPIASVAVRINFASALFAALTCAMLMLVVAELTITASYLAALKRRLKKAARKGKKVSRQSIDSELDQDSTSNWLLLIAPALGSGLLLAFSRTLWSYATIAEVYTLNTLLILTIFFLILRWRRRIVEDENYDASANSRQLAIADYDSLLNAAAVVFGLALGVHHVTVALILPALAVIVYRTEGLKFFTSKRFLYAALFSFAALLAVYSYLPLAAARTPLINWDNPRSLAAIWWHITGKQYQVFFSFAPQMMGEQLAEFGRLALREFGRLPLAFVFAIVGYAYVFKVDRTSFWFLTVTVIANLAYVLSYSISEDKDAYCLLSFISVAIAAGFGLRWLLQLFPRRTQILGALLVLVVPAIAVAANWRFDNRRHYFIAHDYIENIQSTIEPKGLLLTVDWQVVSPMLYTREVEQRRRDVEVVDVNLLRRSWYFDYLRHAYPDLIERSRDKVDTYLVDLRQWEHDPEAYAKSPALSAKIFSAFQEMLHAFVRKELEVGPVYVTWELILMTEGQDVELIQWLNKNYRAVPRGLIFQLSSDDDFHDPGELRLQTRGLTDGTIRFEKDDVVKMKVLPVYKTMLVNRGRYLALFNQHQRAIDAFNQALAFDPNFDIAQQGLIESMNKLRNPETSKP